MDFAQVKELIQMLEASSLRELHVTLGGDSVYLSRNESGFRTVDTPEVGASVDAGSAPVALSPAEKAEPVQAAAASGELVLSPLVGTFFASAAPEKPVFVRVGDSVKAGQTLCIVEAMKVMNEITAKRDGIITEILAENEQLVEYNQPLIRMV